VSDYIECESRWNCDETSGKLTAAEDKIERLEAAVAAADAYIGRLEVHVERWTSKELDDLSERRAKAYNEAFGLS
jgi:hypothetical protein